MIKNIVFLKSSDWAVWVLKKDFTRKKRKGGILDNKWLGPHTITGILGRGLFSLQGVHDADIIPRVNGYHLKIYHVIAI